MIIGKRSRLVEGPKFYSAPLEKPLRQKVDFSTSLKMVTGSFYMPKDEELKPQGEDAHFVCAEEQTIGVADGVGGWALKGIDGGEYARELMINSVISIHNQPKGAVDPKRVLSEAYSNTKVQGSSTACIITLTGQILHAVNVGDSGFMLIRDGKAVYRSPVQQRSFNCPYQLGLANDNPSTAQELEVETKAGDVIVAGTDGLLDNMHDYEIEEMINKGTSEGTQPEQIACLIANLALYNSFDRFADTPYSNAARRAGIKRKGGKIDDITVIIAYVVPSKKV